MRIPDAPGRHALALALALSFAGLAGCTGAGMNAEMRQQELDMKSELASWTSDLDTWKTENAGMQADLESKPAPAGSELEKQVMDLAAEHTEHANNLEEFGNTLGAHRNEVDEESMRPEKDRVLAHSGLWAKHMSLKASHASLSMTHKALMEKCTELLAKMSATQ